jgi:DNA modification methylase
MTPYYSKDGIVLYCGDCVPVMQTMPDNSIDAIVTDPPYGLGFMGKGWDHSVPGVEVWIECLRILKPGGHLLAFAGTRTQHRMACAIEDAGFDIRDMIAWVYGSGFPKSLDVSKAIDKAAGAEREVTGSRMGDVGIQGGNFAGKTELRDTPATPEAQQWSGWGTALKPSLEPITMARKPLIGTVAANVMQYGTGGINVDACRVEATGEKLNGGASDGSSVNKVHEGWDRPWKNDPEKQREARERSNANQAKAEQLGRWPANLIHDGSDEVLALFPETGASTARARNNRPSPNTCMSGANMGHISYGHSDSGSAARFFYTAKADSTERRQSKHPTVKPLDLMRYLVRLVCPAGGIVLDPFMGSGSTIEAARAEHCKSIGMDLSEEYCGDAVERLKQGVFNFAEEA